MIEVPLTRGQIAIVDDEDADLLEYKWSASLNPSYANDGKFIAKRKIRPEPGRQLSIYMHRIILSRILRRELLRLELVDHVDLNPLNNRRENLRLASHSQNAMNVGKPSTNSSGFKGVSWHKDTSKWVAKIKINGEQKYLGLFDTPEEAYRIYCEAAIELFGEFARFE